MGFRRGLIFIKEGIILYGMIKVEWHLIFKTRTRHHIENYEMSMQSNGLKDCRIKTLNIAYICQTLSYS